MITLATLAQATEQEVFDQVAKHMLTQNRKSILADNGPCAYRGANGLKCAAGALMTDEEYKYWFDADDSGKLTDKGGGWDSLVECGAVPDVHASLILALQDVHDRGTVEQWPERLKKVAETYSLQFNQ